jgi:tumor suppressor p53-binding protein 1
MNVIAEYLGNDKNKSLEDILGPIPSSKTLFRNKHFILTCTIPIKGSKEASPSASDVSGVGCGSKVWPLHCPLFYSQTNDDQEPADSMTNRLKKFAILPFVKEHLKNQIEAGGGKVYQHFEDIPKGKYKQCKLIAPHPCVTAKFVQCLAVDIPVGWPKPS